MKFKNLFLFMNTEESANRAITPADLFNPVGWFRPEDLPASGEISTWLDSSGNARNLTQATSANRPVVLANALNGFSAASFDGVNDFLSGTVMPVTSGEYTYIIVSRLKNNPSGVTVMFHNGGGANGYFQARQLTNSQRFLGHGGGADMVVTGNLVPLNTWEISNARRQGGIVDFRVNNSNLAITNSNSTFNTPTGSLWLGSFSGGTNLWQNVDIIEVLFWQSALTNNQTDAVYNYLRSKYNL